MLVNLQGKSKVDIFSEKVIGKILIGFLFGSIALLIVGIEFPKTVESIGVFTLIYLLFITLLSLYTAFWHLGATEYCLKEYNHVEDKFLILSFVITGLMCLCFVANAYHCATYYLYISFDSPNLPEVIRLAFQPLIFLSIMTMYHNSLDLLKKYKEEQQLETL